MAKKFKIVWTTTSGNSSFQCSDIVYALDKKSAANTFKHFYPLHVIVSCKEF